VACVLWNLDCQLAVLLVCFLVDSLGSLISVFWLACTSTHLLGFLKFIFSDSSVYALHLFVFVLYKFTYHMCVGGSAFGHVDCIHAQYAWQAPCQARKTNSKYAYALHNISSSVLCSPSSLPSARLLCGGNKCIYMYLYIYIYVCIYIYTYVCECVYIQQFIYFGIIPEHFNTQCNFARTCIFRDGLIEI